MIMTTKIEWCDVTWNPVTGCTKISAGCKHCYAERFAERFRGVPGHPYEHGFDVTLKPHRLLEPLKWRRPRRVFVNSMSDLFHRDVPDWFIDHVFAIMALCRQHTFLVLTKRQERMRDYIMGMGCSGDLSRLGSIAVAQTGSPCAAHIEDDDWPLPNVWLGVSVENQAAADERIPLLLGTPGAVRFVSAEPLLGPVDLDAIPRLSGDGYLRPLDGRFRTLDWVIAGGESGPKSRPMELEWARFLRDQCGQAQVPFFMKQITERGRKLPFDTWPMDLRVRDFPG